MTESPTPAPAREPGRLIVLTLLLVLMVAHVGLSTWWMHGNGFFSARPPYQDAAWFRIDSWRMLEAWKSGGPMGWLKSALDHDRPHPPIGTMLVAAMSVPYGEVSVKTQWLAEMIFLALLPFVGYRLARNFGGRWFSLLASAAIMSAPVLLVETRAYQAKFPMTVLILWALDSLLRSRAFTRLGHSIGFGVLSALATLTFMLAPLYLVGGGAVALAVGLLRARPRKTVIINAVAACIALLAVCAIWYGRHWRVTYEYVTEVTGDAGQVKYSGGVPFWSLERWIYYPRAVVNKGTGFFLASWIVGALIAGAIGGLRRLVTRTPKVPGLNIAAGWTLAGSLIAAFLIILKGQASGNSEYMITTPPIALLLTACVIKDMAPGRLRATLAVLFGLTCIGTIALVYRPLYKDVEGPTIGQIEVISSYDCYGGVLARQLGVNAAPEGETWPLERFLDVMLVHLPRQQIRLGQGPPPANHDYMNTGNMRYVALRRGVSYAAEAVPVGKKLTDAEFLAEAAKFDFMIVDMPGLRRWPDDVFLQFPQYFDRCRSLGVQVLTIDKVKMSTECELTLLQFIHPGERAPVMPASALDDPRVKRVDVKFGNGWHLVGVEVGAASDKTGCVATFWDPTAKSPDGFELFCQLYSGKDLKQSLSLPMVPLPAGGTSANVAVRCIYFNVGIDPMQPVRVGMRRAGPGRAPEDHVLITDTNLPKFGRFTVDLPR